MVTLQSMVWSQSLALGAFLVAADQVADFCERIGVTDKTLAKLEKGAGGVRLETLAMALMVLGGNCIGFRNCWIRRGMRPGSSSIRPSSGAYCPPTEGHLLQRRSINGPFG